MKYFFRCSHGAAVALAAAWGFAMLTLATPASAQPAEWDGLKLVPSKRIEFVYVRPGASLKGYKRIRLDPVDVSFDKDWKPNRETKDLTRKLSASDMEAIKTGLADEFRKVFAAELGKGGYKLTDKNGEDVLRVTARIMDLYINAPEKHGAGSSYVFVADPGHMTLVIEFRDSTTGQVLGRGIDRTQGRTKQFQMATRVSNSAAAREIIGKWSETLRAALDEVNSRPDAQ